VGPPTTRVIFQAPPMNLRCCISTLLSGWLMLPRCALGRLRPPTELTPNLNTRWWLRVGCADVMRAAVLGRACCAWACVGVGLGCPATAPAIVMVEDATRQWRKESRMGVTRVR